MNIEDSIKILKEFNKIKINSYAMQFVNISYPDLQEAIETLLTAYEKEKEKNKDLEKEIEELKEDRKKYAEEYIHNNPWHYKQLNENYILRVEADTLCNKKWKNKIKAKIKQLDYNDMSIFERRCKQEVLQSLLEKE